MNVLIIGNGGREHALAYSAAKSELVDTVFVAPGNAGTSNEAKCTNVDISVSDIDALIQFAKQNDVELTIVGPEAPLSAGIVDQFEEANLACFGPSRKAAELEASKSFCKHFLKKHQIPTASYETFTQSSLAMEYIETQTMPCVIKADGLAAGKGVFICQNKVEAKEAIQHILGDNAFGDAGHKIVIEDFLHGEEASFIALVDGETVIPFASSQDHKARFDGDTGPNTGGMGAYSPAPIVTEAMTQTILDTVMYPTVQGLLQEGIRYRGFLYAGLMISPDGVPNVLEYNVRLGDPETQPLLLRLKSDLIKVCLEATKGKLDKNYQLEFTPQSALAVVLVAGGYPGAYDKGAVIHGLDTTQAEDIKIFHAGTTLQDNQVVTHGGRVLAVTALGDTLQQAHDKAYQAVQAVSFDNADYRKDIGFKGLKKTT